MSKGYVVRGKDGDVDVWWEYLGGDDWDTTTKRVDAWMMPLPLALACGDVMRAYASNVRIFAVAEDGTETPLPSYEEALEQNAAGWAIAKARLASIERLSGSPAL